ncbi:MAG: esterase [Sphingobacteriia bacterium 24-36-13]|jgi:esterase/lipase superfamily enzyme|uniref:esterase family protein n=1 Tax=Sediminibacterium sp. TaxID=1917865 RepID=UPI000BCAA169|nr:alpha/beta hydrolase-fold protein [Sediminibacterium sp.]OYZ53706.1 MAG: esterase [Sphingobacteriia bacterium 24-36-13]OZA64815.1 MAG: esterase [Sphingobacteriia bacterium 39-36-14]HQS24843.1 alpha/beta hydrolase-fold protein [Sediminibacterium sp.]HQS35436.1 alpha/beta hydrolase-fold protein [Sediminibacterium sp.]
MDREITSWFSPALNKEMPIASYGHFGFAILLIPTAAADYLEYERFQMIDAIAPFINSGKCRVFSIDSMNKESWMNNQMLPEHKAIRHNQFNEYVFNEVVPFIRNCTSDETMIYTCGASFGALHAMNLFMKRPDIINGAISMSGVYDLTEYTKGFWDDQVFYNSPVHYIPSLNDNWYLDKIKASHHIHIYTGSGNFEDPDAAKKFAGILYTKGIWYDLDVWGPDIHHDWPTWRSMLPYILDKKF